MDLNECWDGFNRGGPSKTTRQPVPGWVDESSGTVCEKGENDEGRGDQDYRVEAALAQGIASSLRTLVIASFRAPPNKFVLGEGKSIYAGVKREIVHVLYMVSYTIHRCTVMYVKHF